MSLLPQLIQQYSSQLQAGYYLILLINGLLHLIFAGAIAKDAGNLYKLGQRPALVSAGAWAFATLIGGVITASIYWFIHHSTLTRPISKERHYERPAH